MTRGIPIIAGGRGGRAARPPAPSVFGIEALEVGDTSVTIGWNTDYPATSQIQYGTTTAYGSETTLDTSRSTAHEQTIESLSEATTYYYRVVSVANGRTSYSDRYEFTTGSDPACVITNIVVSDVTDTGCTVTWNTDIAATSKVDYGATSSYGSSTDTNATPTTSHSRDITGLSASTTYHFRCVSVANEQTTNSADGTFETSTTPACEISAVAESNVTYQSAQITWTTDIAATSQVEYGLTASYGSVTAVNDILVTSHSRTISGLTAETTYHYRAVSVANGQTTYSDDGTFVTVAEPDPETEPEQYVVPEFSLPTGGTTWYPYVAGDTGNWSNATHTLQHCLTYSAQGDVIILKAGATYTTGNNAYFYINPKVANGKWLYIISSDMAGLPAEGTRVSPDDASHMAKVTAYSYLQPALIIREGASKIRIAGIELTTNNTSSGFQYGIVQIAEKSQANPVRYSATNFSTDIVLERCWIHGNTTGNLFDNIVVRNVAGCSISECYIDDSHCIGSESHGIHVYCAKGPTRVHNNFICAAGINMFLCDSTGIQNDADEYMTPADVTVTKNLFHKKPAWDQADPTYGGVYYVVKNHWETKGSTRVLVEGNRFEHCWIAGTHFGEPFVVKSNGGDVEHLTIRNNYAIDCMRFLTLSAQAWDAGYTTPAPWTLTMSHVTVTNNLHVTSRSYSGGYMNGITALSSAGHTLTDFTFSHNTTISTSEAWNGWLSSGDSSVDQYTTASISDNIGVAFNYPFFVNGAGSGVTAYNSAAESQFLMQNNVLADVLECFKGSLYNVSGNYGPWYFPDEIANIGFVGDTIIDPEDWALSAESPYKGYATDDTDPGCDIDVLVAALA